VMRDQRFRGAEPEQGIGLGEPVGIGAHLLLLAP
jgi:hypothetical protein